jgi:hypothetical protein
MDTIRVSYFFVFSNYYLLLLFESCLPMARPKAVKIRESKRPQNFVLIFWVLLALVISMILAMWYDRYFRQYMADLISSKSVLSYPDVLMIESTTRVQVDKNIRQEPNNLDLLLMGKTPFQAPLAFLDDQPPLPWNTATRNIILKELQEAISSGTGSIAPRRVSVGDELGIIYPDGTLVVPGGVSYMYWDRRQARLCDLLRNMTLKSSLDDHDHSHPQEVAQQQQHLQLQVYRHLLSI